MSYYYCQVRQADEQEDSVYTSSSLRHPNRGNRQPPCQQYQHSHHNRPYRPQASTDSIPFADAEASSGIPRAGKPLRDAGTSSSEETVNRLPSYINKPRTIKSAGTTSLRRRRPCPPPPPSPPASFLDSEDATSLNNLLDALDDIDVVEEDRRSSLTTTTTGSSRDEDEPVIVRNGQTRPTLASILISIPPPPPEKDTEHGQMCQHEEAQHTQRQVRQSIWSTTHHSNPIVNFELPPAPPLSPKEDNKQTVST
jgi:hypothetical protein